MKRYDDAIQCKKCGSALELCEDCTGIIIEPEKTVKYGSYTVCEPCYADFNRNVAILKSDMEQALKHMDLDFFEKASKIGVSNLNTPAY